MNNLSEKMQERLDRWRKPPTAEKPKESTPTTSTVRRSGKGDYGDASTLAEWEEECKRSQTRK